MRIWFAFQVLVRLITGQAISMDSTSGWSKLARSVREAYEAWNENKTGLEPRPVLVIRVDVAAWLMGGDSSKAVSLEFRLDRMGRYSEAGYPTMGEVLGLDGEWYLVELRYSTRGLRADDIWEMGETSPSGLVRLSWGRYALVDKMKVLKWTDVWLPEALLQRGFEAKKRGPRAKGPAKYRPNKSGLGWAIAEEILPETMQLTLPDRNGRDRLFQIIGSGSSLVQGRKCLVVECGSPLQRHIAYTVPKLGDRISYLQQLVSAQLDAPFHVREEDVCIITEDQAKAWFGEHTPDDMAWEMSGKLCHGRIRQIRGALSSKARGTAMLKGTLNEPSPAVREILRKKGITASLVIVEGCLKAGRGLKDPLTARSGCPLGTMIVGFSDDFEWCGQPTGGARLPALALQWVIKALESRSNDAGAKWRLSDILKAIGPRVKRQAQRAVRSERTVESWLAGEATAREAQTAVLRALGELRESVTIDPFGKRKLDLTQGERDTLSHAGVLVATDAAFITLPHVVAALRSATASSLRKIVRSGGLKGMSLVVSWAPEVEKESQNPLSLIGEGRALDRVFTVMVNPAHGLRDGDLLVGVRNPARSLEGLCVVRVMTSPDVPSNGAWVPALMAEAMDGDRDGDTFTLINAPEMVEGLSWLKRVKCLEERFPYKREEQKALGLDLPCYVDGKIEEPVTPEGLRGVLAQYLGEGPDRIGVYTNALFSALEKESWELVGEFSLAVEVDSKLKRRRKFTPKLVEDALRLASGPNWLRALKGKKSLYGRCEWGTEKVEFGDKLFDNGILDDTVLSEEEVFSFDCHPMARLVVAMLCMSRPVRLRTNVQCKCSDYFHTAEGRSTTIPRNVVTGLGAAWNAAAADIEEGDPDSFRRSLHRRIAETRIAYSEEVGARTYPLSGELAKPKVFPGLWRHFTATKPNGTAKCGMDSGRLTDACGLIRIAVSKLGYETLPTWEEVAKKFGVDDVDTCADVD